MDTPLEELQAEIESNTELSFTVSEIESMLPTDSEPVHRDTVNDRSSPQTDTGSPQRYSDAALTDDAVVTMDGWLDEEYLHDSSDEIIVAQLDEILLLLIAVRDGGCGKELLQDLRRLFGTDLSPGTVYPHLNDLEEEDALEMCELSKRKVYRLADTDAALARVESTVNQLFTVSLVLKALAINCEARHSRSHEPHTDEQ